MATLFQLGVYVYPWFRWVKCLAYEHNAVSWPGFELRQVNAESSTLIIGHRASHYGQNHKFFIPNPTELFPPHTQ